MEVIGFSLFSNLEVKGGNQIGIIEWDEEVKTMSVNYKKVPLLHVKTPYVHVPKTKFGR